MAAEYVDTVGSWWRTVADTRVRCCLCVQLIVQSCVKLQSAVLWAFSQVPTFYTDLLTYLCPIPTHVFSRCSLSCRQYQSIRA